MKLVVLRLFICSILFYACTASNEQPAEASSDQDALINSINTFKDTAENGDLITRLGNDILSYQIKLLNDSSKRYSHAGLVIEKNGQKLVAHITPAAEGADTIQYTPIDSFINPANNLACALYRFKLTASEKASLSSNIESYKIAGVYFDRLYDLDTDSSMYCTELILKALQKATNNRITARAIPVPKPMYKLLAGYFKNEKNIEKLIAQRRYIPIDNLYRNPECSFVMQLNFKTTP